jgi:sodium/hydrogen exchanger 8
VQVSERVNLALFGALTSVMSAYTVDPVATLSIMGNPEMNCNPLLYSLVFGESVLNDAVAIVLFRTFQQFPGEFTNQAVLMMIWDFTSISVGSLICGVLLALVCSFICKETNLRKFPEYEMAILFLFAYGSYAFAEALQLSGIMSLFFCGIVLAHYNEHNLSVSSSVTCEHFFKSFALIAEFFVFIYMGMGFCTGMFTTWDMTFSIIAILACLFARALNIIPFAFIANLSRQKKISYNMQMVMWFAGLRGAIAFALAQNMPGKNRDVFITTTLSVILFTTIVCGGLTEPVLGWAGMKMQAGYKQMALKERETASKAEEGGGSLRGKISKFRAWWDNFEKEVMRPTFTRENPDTALHGSIHAHGIASDTRKKSDTVCADSSGLDGLEGLELNSVSTTEPASPRSE